MAKAIYMDPHKCTTCKMCELACSFVHTGAFNPARSRITIMVDEDRHLFLSVFCTQCEPAYCMRVCPADALVRRDGNGLVEVVEENCIGCNMCVMACPIGTIIVPSQTGIAEKCNLCDGDPECVKVCPPNALIFEEYDPARLMPTQWALPLNVVAPH